MKKDLKKKKNWSEEDVSCREHSKQEIYVISRKEKVGRSRGVFRKWSSLVQVE